ncbi:hypothetical protein [Chroococcidiopsis sp.]|uniref:hypothetical protein n=1 Tax=Chroococcidiopsis sp. TaxID=3088168 RepID=UPI003F30F5C6
MKKIQEKKDEFIFLHEQTGYPKQTKFHTNGVSSECNMGILKYVGVLRKSDAEAKKP